MTPTPEAVNEVPNPGSKEAITQGCKCPVIDNSYGKGYMQQEGIFVFSSECELHTPKTQSNP